MIIDKLVSLAQRVGLVALDVGARGGVNQDLLSLAPGVDIFGFEPDPEECTKLNVKSDKGPWKSLNFIATALADSDRSIRLNLYKKRGCSSVLSARKDLGDLFSRGDYYIHEGFVEAPASTLDSIVVENPIASPAFMKIDVQGMEVDVFTGSQKTLSEHLVGIRTEVSMFPMYESQPLFAEVDQALRKFGFVPMRWLELHEWRRSTRVKYPAISKEPMPFSRGQMMHGDVLYLMHPEAMEDGTDAKIRRLVRLALVAICYGQLDHAHATLSRPRVREFVQGCIGSDPIGVLEKLSMSMARATRWRRALARLALRFHRAPVNWT